MIDLNMCSKEEKQNQCILLVLNFYFHVYGKWSFCMAINYLQCLMSANSSKTMRSTDISSTQQRECEASYKTSGFSLRISILTHFNITHQALWHCACLVHLQAWNLPPVSHHKWINEWIISPIVSFRYIVHGWKVNIHLN